MTTTIMIMMKMMAMLTLMMSIRVYALVCNITNYFKAPRLEALKPSVGQQITTLRKRSTCLTDTFILSIH